MENTDGGCCDGVIIAHQYELVRRILSYLPHVDLVSCGQVCKVWNDATKQELQSKHRFSINMFAWKGTPQTTKV
jgi:hypothetical protein